MQIGCRSASREHVARGWPADARRRRPGRKARLVRRTRRKDGQAHVDRPTSQQRHPRWLRLIPTRLRVLLLAGKSRVWLRLIRAPFGFSARRRATWPRFAPRRRPTQCAMLLLCLPRSPMLLWPAPPKPAAPTAGATAAKRPACLPRSRGTAGAASGDQTGQSIRRPHHQGARKGPRPGRNREAGRAHPPPQLPERARLPRQRPVPGPERLRPRLRQPPLGRLPPDPGGGRARPQGREGDAHHVRRLQLQRQHGPRRTGPADARDGEGRPTARMGPACDRPLVKLHYVFNIEQTEGLQLRPLQAAAAAGVGRSRARRGADQGPPASGSTTWPATARTTA